MTRSLDEQVAALERLSSAELKDQWRRLTAAPLPRISPSLLRLALAWEIQARALGGLSRAAQQKLEQVGRAKTATRSVQPGMRLVRAWNGKAHVVMVGDDGVIRWNEREWPSLSAVANAITGTRLCELGASSRAKQGGTARPQPRGRCAVNQRAGSSA